MTNHTYRFVVANAIDREIDHEKDISWKNWVKAIDVAIDVTN